MRLLVGVVVVVEEQPMLLSKEEVVSSSPWSGARTTGFLPSLSRHADAEKRVGSKFRPTNSNEKVVANSKTKNVASIQTQRQPLSFPRVEASNDAHAVKGATKRVSVYTTRRLALLFYSHQCNEIFSLLPTSRQESQE